MAMTAITDDFVTKVEAAIATIESKADLRVNGFTPTRYPYTYAYDYLRSHQVEFGVTGQRDLMSRGETSAWLNGQVSSPEEKISVCYQLADAYIRENNITTIACAWCGEALVRGRVLIWVTRTGEGYCPTPDAPDRAHNPHDVRSR
jgi:hypothetical protein